MKLDKRACRHAANVPLHISLNAGVLYTERVKYLVTAAVKLLGGHRVLTVYFYDCERLKTNDRIQNSLSILSKSDSSTLSQTLCIGTVWDQKLMTRKNAHTAFYGSTKKI